MNSGQPATLLEYLNRATEFFAERAVDHPRLNAERLLCGVLRCKRIDLYIRFDEQLAQEQVDLYREFLRRRIHHEPIQYILGSTEFYGRDFVVNPDVLIPRPETEGLVEKLIARLAHRDAPAVADIGTGSGCIAVTVAAEIPGARVVASDISQAALEVAVSNAERNGVVGRIRFAVGDLLTPFGGEKFNAIIANLPYVGSDEESGLPPNVVDFEPHVALFSANGGMAHIERLITSAPDYLLPDGIVALEIGARQARDVERLWSDNHPQFEVDCERDLAGLDRYVFASARGRSGGN